MIPEHCARSGDASGTCRCARWESRQVEALPAPHEPLSRPPTSTCGCIERSREVSLLGFELVLVDLPTCVPLTKDGERRVLPRASVLSHEPTNAEHDAADHQPPEHEHH